MATDVAAAGAKKGAKEASASEETTTTAAAVPETTPTETTATATTPPTSTTPTTTSTTPTAPPAEEPETPAVVLKRKAQRTAVGPASPNQTSTGDASEAEKKAQEGAAGNIASSPEMVAEEGALAAVLASSQASVEALGFYRIPLFLLPVYKAAAVQYGIPWQILAAINEIETNYGTDLSVSSAGAVGWMQFMPSTWLQYGVDALNAGYADPYNPVDAIFAAARYLRAAGAATDLHAAILAYNHSEEYATSVLLRAKLISTYPKGVIATLTGLVDGRLPVSGHQLAWTPLPAETIHSTSSATARATAVGTTGAPSSQQQASPSKEASGHIASAPQHHVKAHSAASQHVKAHAAASRDVKAHAANQHVKTQSASHHVKAHAASAPATSSAPVTPGSTAAVSPSAAAAGAGVAKGAGKPTEQTRQFVELTTAPGASVLAVQDGRVIEIGKSRQLGRFVVLRDVYGDLFTYAGLGSVAPTYFVPKPSGRQGSSQAVKAASTHDPAPSEAATAGVQPVTLQVKTPTPHAGAGKKGKKASAASAGQIAIPAEETVPAGMNRPRIYAKPDNPDAHAAALLAAARAAKRNVAGQRVPLKKGSVVTSGTVLGKVSTPKGAKGGHLRFAIRPAGDGNTVEAGPILTNWAELQNALHPQGSKERNALLGATAGDAFLLTRSELERTVLSDPGITIYGCGRQDIASGKVDSRVLALLAFLSRSGLEPTVSALRCGQSQYSAAGTLSAQARGDAVSISAINGVPVAHHQGPGTITDLTIRALLTVPVGFVPAEIISLMHYPGSANTRAQRSHAKEISVVFAAPAKSGTALSPKAAATAAHSAKSGAAAPAPVVTTSTLSAADWTSLIARIGGLPVPKVPSKPTKSAIPDKQQSQTAARRGTAHKR
ncbi:MAG TPA: lytic murein transglycosylase [Solirubrobacteraceae bacterium]